MRFHSHYRYIGKELSIMCIHFFKVQISFHFRRYIVHKTSVTRTPNYRGRTHSPCNGSVCVIEVPNMDVCVLNIEEAVKIPIVKVQLNLFLFKAGAMYKELPEAKPKILYNQ